MTSLIAKASRFMAFTQPQIVLCGASPDAARRASPALKGKLPMTDDNIRRYADKVPIPPGVEVVAGLLGSR